MKLAFLCNNMKSTNGVERVLSQRLSLLAESGMYEVYLITYNQYGTPFSFHISDKVHYIDLATRYINKCCFNGFYQYWDRFISRRKYENAIRACLEQILPDVITCVDIHLADLLTILNIKTEAAKVVECHCGMAAYYGDLGKIKSPYERFLKRMQKMKIVRTIRKFDKFVVMTQAELIDWNNDTKAVCIPNMLATFPDIMPNDVRQIKHRINCVGRYAYQKGYDMLIDAWRIVQTKHPDWSLHIYGSRDGDAGDYEQLQYVIGENDMQNIYLHPATNDVYSKYVGSDFYVISSRYESFGLTLIEAMSCGLPIVSFNCKYGPASILKDGETGILVPQNDVEKLADAICSMIENEEIRQQMGENARLESKKYLPENIMPLWHEFYKSLGKGHPIHS